MPATHEEAIQLLLKNNLRATQTYYRLRHWEADKTLLENSRKLRMTPQNVAFFVRKYGLEFRRSNKREPIIPIDLNIIQTLRRQGMPLVRIGHLYGVSKQNIDHILHPRKALKTSPPKADGQ